MAEKLMTLGVCQRTFTLRGKSTTLVADFRDVDFSCDFVDGAINGAPQIRITVTRLGTSSAPRQTRIELIPPFGRPVAVTGNDVVFSAFVNTRRLPRRLTNAPTRSLGTSRFAVNPHGFETPAFGDGTSVIGDFRPPGGSGDNGGGGGSTSAEVVEHTLVPGVDRPGRWKVRLHNQSLEAADFLITVEHPETVQTLQTTRVPFKLLNGVFAEALFLMSPSIRISNGTALIRFRQEFKALTGIEDIRETVPDLLQDMQLEQLELHAGPDEENGCATFCIDLKFEEEGSEIELPGPDADIHDMALQVGFHLSLFTPGNLDFFTTALKRFNEDLIQARDVRVTPFVNANPLITSLWIDILEAFIGPGSIASLIDQRIKDAIDKIEGALGKAFESHIADFIRGVLVHLVEQTHAIHSITCDTDAMIVRHHALPGAPGSAATPASGPTLVVAEHPAQVRLRVGQIDHIVVLMMENRSFDHMLGYLALQGKPARGLTGNETNSIPEGSPPYRVHHLTETGGIPTPPHDFDHAIEQIAGGAMSGFAASSAKRRSVTDAGAIMGYFNEAELPMYNFLADQFAICDAWFSSHPGSTFANRFCVTTGQTPELDNFDLGDERIGYFKGVSIFDVLSNAGVDWAYAEGNVGFLRIFDRYRLDVGHVIPYTDHFNRGLDDTFEQRVHEGRLPAVSFIDPRFIDFPPDSDANDDLPPADVCLGQKLVKRVYDLLSSATQTWPRTLLIVTYDEHGGFFDHVPPPGTPFADDPSPLPRVHPDGVDHLGVRVPAFIVSPWVDAGVITTPFDHTTVIKTIMERFVSTERANVGLSSRSAQANSLLAQLRTSARTAVPLSPEFDCALGPTVRGPATGDDFQTAMRLLGLPAAARRKIGGG